MSAVRPNRSDAHLSPEEERKMEEETREHFQAIAPKRHSKPQRSEYSAKYSDDLAVSEDDNATIPELVKFQSLESEDPKKLVYNGSEAMEEYVETEYYKDLNGIDKQHHTTGTGFIGVDTANSNYFMLEADSDNDHHSSSRGNPATNDWIPSAPDTIPSHSNKPSRSENK